MDGQDGGVTGEGRGGGGRHADGRGGGGGNKKNKRRRQRPQRQKRRKPTAKENAALDSVGRERIFQHIEGLLRQIREQAEEFNDISDDELSEHVTTVTTFMKLMDEESEPLTERARSEYLRVRDKLTQALR